MKKLSVLSFIVFMVFASCTKVIEFTGEESEPLLVVNGIQHVGETPSLIVGKSNFFLNSEEDYYAKGVVAKLFVNGEFVENLTVRDTVIGFYYYKGNKTRNENFTMCYCTGNYIFQEGDHVHFEVSSDDFDKPVTADVVMPTKPEVSYFDTLRVKVTETWPPYEENPYWYYFTDADGNPCRIYEWGDVDPETGEWIMHADTIYPGDPQLIEVTAKLGINDPEGEQYYNLETLTAQSYSSTDPVFSDFAITDAFEGSSVYYCNTEFNVFSDKIFQGTLYDLKFSWNVSHKHQCYIYTLSLVDEHCFKYIQSYRKYEDDILEGLGGMFAEPMQVYSNVKGGIGIVGAQGEPVVVEMVIDDF